MIVQLQYKIIMVPNPELHHFHHHQVTFRNWFQIATFRIYVVKISAFSAKKPLRPLRTNLIWVTQSVELRL